VPAHLCLYVVVGAANWARSSQGQRYAGSYSSVFIPSDFDCRLRSFCSWWKWREVSCYHSPVIVWFYCSCKFYSLSNQC